MHIHREKYVFPHLQEVKVFEHMSNLLSISAFMEEIQLQGQILLRFFHQPHELKIWKNLLHNQEKNLRTRKQTISCILIPKPDSYTQWCFDRLIPCMEIFTNKPFTNKIIYKLFTNKNIYTYNYLQMKKKKKKPSAFRVPAVSQHSVMPWSCNTNSGLHFHREKSI